MLPYCAESPFPFWITGVVVDASREFRERGGDSLRRGSMRLLSVSYLDCRDCACRVYTECFDTDWNGNGSFILRGQLASSPPPTSDPKSSPPARRLV